MPGGATRVANARGGKILRPWWPGEARPLLLLAGARLPGL
jgi:hypothetical protein